MGSKQLDVSCSCNIAFLAEECIAPVSLFPNGHDGMGAGLGIMSTTGEKVTNLSDKRSITEYPLSDLLLPFVLFRIC